MTTKNTTTKLQKFLYEADDHCCMTMESHVVARDLCWMMNRASLRRTLTVEELAGYLPRLRKAHKLAWRFEDDLRRRERQYVKQLERLTRLPRSAQKRFDAWKASTEKRVATARANREARAQQ